MPQMMCPQCGQAVEMSTKNGWRPFCSERCKLLDLGAWTSGRYSIAAEESAETDFELPPERPQ